MKTNDIRPIIADSKSIAFCGLYCGACRSYLKGKCPGCEANTKASWCKIRECCMTNNYKSCADCNKTELADCKKFNNAISKVFGFVFNSDRSACIARIKDKGYEGFAAEMADGRMQTIKRRK